MAKPYIPNDTPETRIRLLEALGLHSVEEAFSDIPFKVRASERPSLPKGRSEMEVKREVERILAKNRTAKDLLSFLGGGAWSHYVPSAVDALASRGEFLTSYTPYQPEVSQGMLQSLFEYQSMLAEVLEMDVVNSSMYDWASALGEAARMTARVTHRSEFLVPHFISPERRMVLNSYTEPAGIRIGEIHQSLDSGQLDLERLQEDISNRTAGIYVENPAYLGNLIDHLDQLEDIAHDSGSLLVMGVDPSSLGILKPPGRYGADIVIGEGQPLGNHLNYGGPMLGIFASREDNRLTRQMPGRLVGMTTTEEGLEKGYCMVLQTREQHIRREKATSNICTNHALCALRAAVFMALMGGRGFRRLGEYIYSMTNYAISQLSSVKGLSTPLLDAYHFKEFTVRFEGEVEAAEAQRRLLEKGITGGKYLGKDFPELGRAFLYAVTEMTTTRDVDRLREALRGILEV